MPLIMIAGKFVHLLITTLLIIVNASYVSSNIQINTNIMLLRIKGLVIKITCSKILFIFNNCN